MTYVFHWHPHQTESYFSLWLLPGLYHYWWHITSLESHLGKKETPMFYLASVITFSVFLELLWTSLIFVHCYLEDTPGLYRYIKWSYMVNGDLPYGSSYMSQLALALFLLCNGLCCSLPNDYWNNYNIVLRYACFYHYLSGWNYIISLTPNYWRKFYRAVMWRQLVTLK